MPRKGAAERKPQISRSKKTIKTAPAASFFVAPTTPFIPKKKPVDRFKIKTAVGTPSPHLIDLRAITASRPNGVGKKISKLEQASLAGVTVPRTLSGRPNAARPIDQLTIVAFARFLFSIAKTLIAGAGQLVVWPLTLGLALVEKFDPDRAVSLETETVAETAPARYAPVETQKAPEPIAPRRRPFNLRRALVSFAGTSLAIILPIQGLNAWRAVQTIKEKADNARTVAMGALNGTATLNEAQEAIAETRKNVDDLGRIANTLLDNAPKLGGMFRSGKALLNAGSNLSAAAALLGKSLDFINDPSLNMTAKLARAEDLTKQAQPLLARANDELAAADPLPEDVGGDLASLKEKITAANGLAASFLRIAPALRNVLGENESRRYLVIFQNNAELRPTGGFIGSFALVDVDRGEIKAVQVPAGGSYDLQGSLKASVLSPDPLRLINAKWEFQDANWFPDFPTSAKKLTWFYNQSAGPTVDGVIAINAPVLASLLDAIGPINMPAYGVTATGTTVLRTAQEIVESDAARASGKPKQFIADLMPLVLQRILSSEGDEAMRTLSIFAESLQKKDIQIALAKPDEQAPFDELGWTGRMENLPQGFDAIELVRANIAGAKTDAVMKTDIRHESVIAENGTVTDHVTVTLSHEGKKGDKFTGVRNVSYLRLYVPEGSKLIKASGDIRPPAPSFFDIPPEGCGPDRTLSSVSGAVLHDPSSGTAINSEFGRTAFGVWTQTDPGKSSTIVFDYTLPFVVTLDAQPATVYQKLGLGRIPSAAAAFGLVIEKQSGANDTEINSTLKLPAAWYPSYASPAGIASYDGWSFTSELDTDKVIGAIISR